MRKYKSKIGLGIVIFIAIVLGGTSTLMIINKAWPGLIINLALIGFVSYLFTSTYYIINGNDLTIKCGLFFKSIIKIDKIKIIKETNNPLSSPATSLDRIVIYYNKSDLVMISPKNKIDFINHLVKINNKIELLLKKKQTTVKETRQ